MNHLFRFAAATLSGLSLLLVCASPALAAPPPSYTKVLAQHPAAAACTPKKTTGVALYRGGFMTSIYDGTFSCGVDAIRAPADKIDTATVYLRTSDTSVSARLCFQSLLTGGQLCGIKKSTPYYQSGYHQLTVPAPSGTFSSLYVAYVEVTIPQSWNSNYFYGFSVNQLVTVGF